MHLDPDLGIQPQLNVLTSRFTVAAWTNPPVLEGVQRMIASRRPNGFGFGLDSARLIFTTFGWSEGLQWHERHSRPQ